MLHVRTRPNALTLLIPLWAGTMAHADGPGPDAEQGPPEGWTLVKITDDPEQDRHVRMNNNGEIIFSKRSIPNPGGTQEEIYHYHNGKLRRLTYNHQGEEWPDINDDGVMIWQRLNHATGLWHIIRYEDGVEEQISTPEAGGGLGSIGNSGLIMWSGRPVLNTLELYEYRDGVVTQLTNNGLTNRTVAINDDDDYSWVRYDFTNGPWVSTIMSSINGEIHELTDGTTQSQGFAITNDDLVGWTDDIGVQLWMDGEITVIPGTEDDSGGPTLNNKGDVLFYYWVDDSFWGVFLYQNQNAFMIAGDPNGDNFNFNGGDINDIGEIVLCMGEYPEHDVYLMWRIREAGEFTGDGVVNAFDFESMQNCMSNVECGVQIPTVCLDIFDFDMDGDIDFADFGTFQRLVTPNP